MIIAVKDLYIWYIIKVKRPYACQYWEILSMRTNAPRQLSISKSLSLLYCQNCIFLTGVFCRKLGFILLSEINVWLEALICLSLWLLNKEKKTGAGKHCYIGSIYNVSNCKHFIGNGCEETSFNFLGFFLLSAEDWLQEFHWFVWCLYILFQSLLPQIHLAMLLSENRFLLLYICALKTRCQNLP